MNQEEPFLSRVDVSRETLELLRVYAQLVERWNRKINLVSPATIPNLWSRHFLDSAQIWDTKEVEGGTWLDFGSGGGFPALVLAILAKEKQPDMKFHLVESDQRKAVFLRTVVRETQINAKIHAIRVETMDRIAPDIISARALAPLKTLLEYAYPQQGDRTVCLFPKGQNVKQEIEDARKSWDFSLTEVQSKTDPEAKILVIREIVRA